ncbi:sucrase ferredoxin [Actinoplanes missouriensis]|uniref:sucrase ferredoxin n=1 Tax=Actinoplanes missouriensis TaxID=1866 RepID=UPI0033D3F843
MTAVPARRHAGWILLADPRPWDDRPAAVSSALPLAVRAAAGHRGLRLQLIRRPRHDPGGDGLTCILVSANGTRPVIEQGLLPDTAAVLDLDLDGLRAGRRTGFGSVVTGPVFLVCTQERPNATCADAGHPVAAALTAAGAEVWETSHLGGCRLAANVVSLPDGLCYGCVTPDDATDLVTATGEGRIVEPLLRGRYGQPQPVQAAEKRLRDELCLTGVDDVVVAEHWRLPGGRIKILFTVRGEARWMVVPRQPALAGPALTGRTMSGRAFSGRAR